MTGKEKYAKTDIVFYRCVDTFLVFVLLWHIEKPQEKACERNTVYIGSGVYENKEWKTSDFTLGKTIVKGKKDAIRIAQAVYDGQLRHKKLPVNAIGNIATNPDSVYYDDEDDVWGVSFLVYTENENGEKRFFGALLEICIRGADGSVVSCDFPQ